MLLAESRQMKVSLDELIDLLRKRNGRMNG